MKRHRLPFSRRYYQFRYLAKRINRWLQDGTWMRLSAAQQSRWLHKLRQYYAQLSGVLAPSRMKRVLAGAAVLLGLGLTQQAQAQINFALPVKNPFGITPAAGVDYFYPAFADLDGDGDLDLISNSYNIVTDLADFAYFENIGSASSPQFAAPVYNPFGLTGVSYYNTAAITDLDGDGDYDILTVEDYGVFKFFENIGTAQAPQFAAPVDDPFGLAQNPAGNDTYFSPTFSDLDDDGDMDLFVGGIYGTVAYYENSGTAQNPAFSAPVVNPNGIQLPQTLLFPNVALADLDQDGDMDLVSGGFTFDIVTYTVENQLYYQENIGDAMNPQFDTPKVDSFGLSATTGYYQYVTFADIDNDGDQDLFVGAYDYGNSAGLFYFENTSSFNVGLSQPLIHMGLSPVPARDFITVDIPPAWQGEAVAAEILDITGRSLLTGTAAQQATLRFSTQQLPAGTYLLRLTADGKAITRQFLKQ